MMELSGGMGFVSRFFEDAHNDRHFCDAEGVGTDGDAYRSTLAV
jgi:hypothetical protein